MGIQSAIDLGTNTCLLLIADLQACPERIVGDYSRIVRLGQGVDQSRSLHPDAITRTLAALKEYAEQVKKAGLRPQDALCVATSQARDARNGAEFFRRVLAETGFKFEVISGDREAELTFLGGVLPGMDPERSVVVDLGGGSTELMAKGGGRSIDMGSVRFTERFLKSDPVTDAEFWSCQEKIDELLTELESWRGALRRDTELVAVAGTATTLAAWHLGLEKFDPQAINQVELTRGDLHRMVEELKWRKVSERAKLPGIEAGRADVILAGALILWRTLEQLGFQRCRVSTRGLRYGVLLAGN